MSTRYIYTETNDCQDCYKCIRECPVKAIKMEDQSASIMQDQCIICGHCTQVCPVGAKKVKEDISTVKYFLKNHQRVIVSLAPSYISEFPEYSQNQFISALKSLGFSAISETALGAEIVSSFIKNDIQKMSNGVYISPCCPSTIELIKKYYPQHSDKILAVDTPMLAHGKYLRDYYGKETKIVFIGPCIAKKKEADLNQGIIDTVITFKRLREWFEEEKINPAHFPETGKNIFQPVSAGIGNLYPIEGGMIASVKDKDHAEDMEYLSYSGVDRLMPILSDLEHLATNKKVFLELMACEGGCINGPGNTNHDSVVIKTLKVRSNNKKDFPKEIKTQMPEDLINHYDYIDAVEKPEFSDNEIIDTLKSIGKYNQKDELNCGGCGYESCRDFAKAVLNGMAEEQMCISYNRRVAQDKASALLQRMPYGVVIVDNQMKIVECNYNFAELTGKDSMLAYEAKPGLKGVDLAKLISYSHYFENLLHAGEGSVEKDIKTESHFLHLSVFTLQKNHLLCAILHNLRAPEIKREEIIKRSRKVIRENLATVQKIAFYLGENASSMETLLNSIVDIQKEKDEE